MRTRLEVEEGQVVKSLECASWCTRRTCFHESSGGIDWSSVWLLKLRTLLIESMSSGGVTSFSENSSDGEWPKAEAEEGASSQSMTGAE